MEDKYLQFGAFRGSEMFSDIKPRQLEFGE